VEFTLDKYTPLGAGSPDPPPYEPLTIGNAQPLTLIAGPCVIESAELCHTVAAHMQALCAKLGLGYIFKASYDKANRSSGKSYRGPGLDAGLAVLAEVRARHGVPVVTDVHEVAQVEPAARVVDVLQVPAFLSRQTDLVLACAEASARHGCAVAVKKGQFMAPWDMGNVVSKLAEGGCARYLLTERGASFGYNNLVVDYRGLLYFKEQGWPVCFDATHAVQRPAGAGDKSSGDRQYVAGLSTAAVSLGIASLFWEVHPDPDNAKSDGPNMLQLDQVEPLLTRIAELDRWAKR
jgi:2-dehydro-3-deoxyphosphooctonate aldolase (KDO 8-P synthase)